MRPQIGVQRTSKGERIEAAKDEDGKWRVNAETATQWIEAYQERKANREAAREAKLLEELQQEGQDELEDIEVA